MSESAWTKMHSEATVKPFVPLSREHITAFTQGGINEYRYGRLTQPFEKQK